MERLVLVWAQAVRGIGQVDAVHRDAAGAADVV